MTGNYLVHVTDLNTGCSSTSVNYPIVVNPSPLTPVISANAAQPLCEGQQFILTITNPEQNAVYNWNTGQTGISIPAASEGEYFASTVNQFGCKAISEKAVIHPSPDLSCIPSGCFQLCDSILPYTVTGPGGFSNYQWQVLNGSVFETVTTTKDLVVLTNGLYRLVVTNSFGCTATSETLELNFIQCGYCTMVATISSSANVKCYGGNDGSATVTVSDGNGPFAYSWNSDPVQSTSTATGLKAGTYIVKIADARGCHIEISVTITEPSQTLKAFATPGTILCYGGSTNITVSASGGTSPYSGTGTFTRDAGAYSYTVTDANLCTSIISGLITQPETLIVSSTLGIIACFGGSTNVTVTAIGGILPYSGTGVFAHGAGAYSYTVTDFNNCTAATSGSISQPAALNATSTAGTILCYGGTTNVTVTASGGTLPYTGTGSFSRSAGSYSYTVTDFNHCTAVTTGNISQPAVLNATSTAGTILCYGGTTNVTVSASGGTSPYTGIGSFSRSAGSYSYKVMDANRCTAVTSGNISQPTLIVVTVTSGVISCYGGTTTVTVTASGGTPAYTGTGTFTVSAGIYTYKVTDSNGCTSTISKTIVQPAVISISINKVDVDCYNGNNGTATAIVTGGTSPYTYLWNTSPAQTTSTATGLKVGSYTVTVKDSKNCTQSTTVAIVNISCTGFKTYTQGGYGAVPSGNNPGTYVQQKFALAFPSGLTVGCTKTLKLTTAQSVIDFLPSSGTPVALKSNLVNSATYSNTLAGQVVTLKLNLVFDIYDPAFSPSTTSLKSLIIGTKTFAGWTVNQLMNEANNVLGGCSSRYTPAQINEAVTNVNQNYDNGNTNAGYLLCPCVGLPSMPNFNYRIDLIETDVEKHLDFSIYPNPNTGDFTIEFESSGLTVEHIVVYNIYGQKVYSQTIDHPMEGNNSLNINLTGVEVGIYFIQFLRGEVEEKMKKIIIVR